MTTYQDLADRLGVTLCRSCDQDHDLTGSVTDDAVHFSERRVQRPDTLAFLKLVARQRDPSIDTEVPWRRVYRLNMAVRGLSRELGIRNPAHPARGDRAFVLASVAGMSNSVPMRKQAFDWARRGPKRRSAR